MQGSFPNLGDRQRRRRLTLGGLALAVAAALAAALAAAGAPMTLRAMIALPLYGAVLGFLQYREKT